ncbi:hypothetical protein IFM89_030658 [Coptis chinensis]|uniref:MI domain-containing protein n=1 Tax=Coptis chinensis TaxID=261450 RepID=A0A835MG88_9MAGN|nr:hypothetical protein IFM89_030658 [Coptis chinensis]
MRSVKGISHISPIMVFWGQRLCMFNKIHRENFETCFVQQYSSIHQLETNKLRNVAKFFAHLLGTDALPWHVLSYIRLTKNTRFSINFFTSIGLGGITENHREYLKNMEGSLCTKNGQKKLLIRRVRIHPALMARMQIWGRKGRV